MSARYVHYGDRVRLGCFVVLAALLAATPAHADHWWQGKKGKTRLLHMGVTAGLGLAYLSEVTVLKSTLTAEKCRWCNPGGIDNSFHRAFVWSNPSQADTYSSIDAYIIAPLVGATLLYFSDKDASWGRLLDDTIPVAEGIAVAQFIVSGLKFATARTRPYEYYGSENYGHTLETRLSFPSGHASFGFAMTTGAAMVCHWRHYWTEPYVWASGITLSLSVEYLRIAADKHWMTDVVVGGLIGVGSGIAIPTLLRQKAIAIVPVPNGAAVVGQF